MAWNPISHTVPQYFDGNGDPYSGAVLKAYADGTSTNINMATDNTGGTTASSMALNASGYPEVSGSVVIPHVEEAYKLSLYPTQSAADADSGAIWTIDNLDASTTSREVLTANRNYYISTTGSDSNTGLSAGAPWATFAKAVSVVQDDLDFAGYKVTINLAAGTYTERLIIFGPTIGQRLDGDLVFTGDTVTPTNVVLQNAASNPVDVSYGARCQVEGVSLETTTGTYLVKCWQEGRLLLGDVKFAAANATGTTHMQAGSAYILIVGDYEIATAGDLHAVSEGGTGHIDWGSNTITLTGTPAFNRVFLGVGEGSTMSIHNVTWSGSATGQAYTVTNQGSLMPVTSRSSIPGSTSGEDWMRETIHARVAFNGTGTLAELSSKNCSVTDNGTGDYTVTLDVDHADDDYTIMLSGVATDGTVGNGHIAPSTVAVGTFDILTANSAGTAQDWALVHAATVGARAPA